DVGGDAVGRGVGLVVREAERAVLRAGACDPASGRQYGHCAQHRPARCVCDFHRAPPRVVSRRGLPSVGKIVPPRTIAGRWPSCNDLADIALTNRYVRLTTSGGLRVAPEAAMDFIFMLTRNDR